MADFAFVKDQIGKVAGVWVKRRSDADDQIYIMTLFMRGGVSTDVISSGYRIVSNKVDSNGGYFVMLGSAKAPGK